MDTYGVFCLFIFYILKHEICAKLLLLKRLCIKTFDRKALNIFGILILAEHS